MTTSHTHTRTQGRVRQKNLPDLRESGTVTDHENTRIHKVALHQSEAALRAALHFVCVAFRDCLREVAHLNTTRHVLFWVQGCRVIGCALCTVVWVSALYPRACPVVPSDSHILLKSSS